MRWSTVRVSLLFKSRCCCYCWVGLVLDQKRHPCCEREQEESFPLGRKKKGLRRVSPQQQPVRPLYAFGIDLYRREMGKCIMGPSTIANSEQLGGKTWVHHKRIAIIHLHKWTRPKSIKCMFSYRQRRVPVRIDGSSYLNLFRVSSWDWFYFELETSSYSNPLPHFFPVLLCSHSEYWLGHWNVFVFAQSN